MNSLSWKVEVNPSKPRYPTIGQLFISHTIRTYGALLFATVMTTRQFISILLSCVLFGHPLSLGQWGGTATVFGALYYKTLSKKEGASGTPKAGAAGDSEAGLPSEKLPLTTEGVPGEAK